MRDRGAVSAGPEVRAAVDAEEMWSPFERYTSFGVAPVTLVSSISSTPSFSECFIPNSTSFG